MRPSSTTHPPPLQAPVIYQTPRPYRPTNSRFKTSGEIGRDYLFTMQFTIDTSLANTNSGGCPKDMGEMPLRILKSDIGPPPVFKSLLGSKVDGGGNSILLLAAPICSWYMTPRAPVQKGYVSYQNSAPRIALKRPRDRARARHAISARLAVIRVIARAHLSSPAEY